jgi:hypothetical protein
MAVLQEIEKPYPRFISFVIANPFLTPMYKFLSLVSNRARVNMDVYPLLPSFQKAISITAVGLLFYTLVRSIYNAYFHPLSRFPGPRGAACTRLWLAYMEVGRGVSLSTLRAELHQEYGTLPLRSLSGNIDADQVTLYGSPRMR